ncbi:glutamic acid-rich protein isoform X2 [Austrofundulus limnaeus]|uniref:Glutamic acid-rich protein isoform X2 n=1 Tax=Austrofundulus limnaeus TaxID=52670 RepID=A0A2I4C0G6_AUSLI|nr:PREDICTED: glutamic acid-rich protein-like isoform X2 [Austrofundulus limnaeus]
MNTGAGNLREGVNQKIIMSRKKAVVKGGPPKPVIRENSRLMRTHESVVDFISGRSSGGSLLGALGPALFGLQFPKSLEDDLLYTDEDDDDDTDDDNDDDYYYPQRAIRKHLEPHPQIKQLTDEEADKIAKELIEEEERRKGKTEKNKRKKQRKKEKKRLEKENAPEENSPDVEKDKCDPSKDQDQRPTNCSNSEKKECSKLSQSQSEQAACKKHKNTKEQDLISVNKKDENHQKGLNLNNSKSVPEEKSNQKFTNEKNKDKNKVQKLEEVKPKVPEKPELPQKAEDETSETKTLDPAVEEFAKRSIELASVGNRLAASGQFETAVSCFTDAIKYNPKEYKLFGNRSLCYERLQQYENALRDADLALSMEPKWIKGLFRKGKALCGLKRYYEASLIYKDVLKLESTSAEAAQELKRAQTLHLMEMGFSWPQSSEALKTHGTLEEAIEALFAGDSRPDPKGAEASWDTIKMQNGDDDDDDDEDNDEGEWIVQQPNHPRQQSKNVCSLVQTRTESHSPTPHSRSSGKPKKFAVWVGVLAHTMTYVKLHELFSRAGTVYSIKMLLEQQCAFVNYTRKEDCERAIQCIDGMVVEGAPLTVRYPQKFGLGGAADPGPVSSTYKKECFFWRTIGCTREDCTFRHIPEHKNLDKDKVTSRLGLFSHVGDHK